MDSPEITKEGFPSKDKFYGSLTGNEISDKYYENFANVWNDQNEIYERS